MTDTSAEALTKAQALWLFPSLKSLLLLREANWTFFPVEGADDSARLDGYRSWGKGWRDCIRVRTETDALGLRIHVPADKHTQSEIMSEFSGTLTEVVEKLLALPAPGSRLAPNLAIGSAPRLWTP